MKAKVFVLGLICFFIFSFCVEYIENPHSSDLRDLDATYIDFEFEVTITVALAEGTFFATENDYCYFTLFLADFCMGGFDITFSKPNGSFSGVQKISLISTFEEEVMSIDYELQTYGTSIEEEWLKTAQFVCTFRLVPITWGFVFDPDRRQMTVTGWAYKEIKPMFFTLTKK